MLKRDDSSAPRSKDDCFIPPLAVPDGGSAHTMFGRWLSHGESAHLKHATRPWYHVLWLTGVDYFSTLGYQPGIALLAAGSLSPIATIFLVAVTLFGALPIYHQVAARSYAGQGSIAMLENLLTGWFGKIFVLVMLGFAGTDFVITITLSAADATKHAIENPILHPYIGEAMMPLTMALIAMLAIVFLRGFGEAIGVAAAIGIPFLLLNLIVLSRGVFEIIQHPDTVSNWKENLFAHGDMTSLLLAAAIIFPKLALGMSGFETGVSVMPLVSGGSNDKGSGPPIGRIRNTRKLLTTAAVIMSFYLLLSSFVTTLLVPESAYRSGGEASGRAIAYLAHALFGHTFGSLYDFVTISILWFAGASAMAGLLNLIPRYLPRFGMAPLWVAHRRPLVLVIFTVSILVTWIFNADVEKQSGAYATGVLALILSASVAVALAHWREFRETKSNATMLRAIYFWLLTAVFAFTFFDNVIERPDGVLISSVFIAVIIVMSAASRYQRATELRVAEIRFADEESKRLWPEITGKKVNLLPLERASVVGRKKKNEEVRKHYQVRGPLAFLHVELVDNRSEFEAPLQITIEKDGMNYFVSVTGAVAIANTIAYVSELIDPISIFLGLTRESLMLQSFRYLLWGEGETGLMVYKILLRYWEWTPESDVRPMIFLMSE